MTDLYNRSFTDPAVSKVRNMPQWKQRDVPFAFAIAHTGATAQASGDKLYVASVHPEARLSFASGFKNEALTGLTDIDFGDINDPDGLIDGANLATASAVGKQLFPALFANGKVTDPLWKLLGYTESPDKPLDLYFTLKATPTASGAFEGNLVFSEPA